MAKIGTSLGGLTQFRAKRDAFLREALLALNTPEKDRVVLETITAREGGGEYLRLNDKWRNEPQGRHSLRAAWDECAKHAQVSGVEGSASDIFLKLLSTDITLKLYSQPENLEPRGMRICKLEDVPLLETDNERAILGQFPLLTKLAAGVEPPTGVIPEAQLKIQTYAQMGAVSIKPKDIINDRLDVFAGAPDKLRRAAIISAELAIVNALYAPGTCSEDTRAFYSALYHGNVGTSQLTLNNLGMTAAIAGRNAMVQQKGVKDSLNTGAGWPLMHEPKFMVVPTALRSIANAICNRDQVPNSVTGYPMANEFADYNVEPLELPLLDPLNVNHWYLMADPNDSPALSFSILDGIALPVIFAGWNTGGKVFDTQPLIRGNMPIYPVVLECRWFFNVNNYDYRGVYAQEYTPAT